MRYFNAGLASMNKCRAGGRVRLSALGAVRRVLALSGMRYLGRPSSYYGYLQKLERPAQGRRRVVKLPYSEL